MTERGRGETAATEIRIPEDEREALEIASGDSGDELSEKEKNLAVAQARLIGDL